MSLSRRAWLGGAGVALAAAGAAWADEPPLRDLAAAKGLRFGSAIGGRSFGDAQVRALVAAQCALVVPENELKWQALRPAPGVFAFDRADAILGWAAQTGLAVRGHNLFWTAPKWFPAWVNSYDFGSRPASEAERLIVEHVTTVVTRYGARIGSWDVVNEAIDPATGELRANAFTPYLGERCLDIAFHAARAAAPRAQMVYNDYMGWEAGNERHRAGVLRLLGRLKARGVPVDALGVQSHLGPGDLPTAPLDRAQPEAWRRFLGEATGMDLGLLVTEFDVDDRGVPGDVATRDAEVAAYAKAYLDLTLSFPQLRDVLCWGLDDRYSWLQSRSPRADGARKRGCPYGEDLRPKPLRAAMAEAFRAAPRR
ncbi:MAG: glycosyl hydrolase [Phenylobacterium sp.]|nr:MAG: glycosyl hydrolase [Phenylobacterium sp.]